MSDKKIVVLVDDQPDRLELMIYNLDYLAIKNQIDIDFMAFLSGEDAKKYLLTKPASILIIEELSKDTISGAEIIKELRNNPLTKNLTILAHSDIHEMQKTLKNAGANHFFTTFKTSDKAVWKLILEHLKHKTTD